MKKPKILFVDDNEKLCVQVKEFNGEKFEIDYCLSGEKAIELIKENEYQLLIFDLILDDKNGIELYKEIKENTTTPTIFISGFANSDERIEGLQMGAEDFIRKPFDLVEFQLKIEKIIERTQQVEVHCYGDYQVNSLTRQIIYKDKLIKLSPAPYRLMIFLLKNPNTNLTRDEILRNVWNYKVTCGDRVVDTNISILRNKTQDGRIKSVRGVGYRYELD